jgi:hypothetical protein
MTRRALLAAGPILCLAACSPPPEPKAPEKPPEPVTGLHALYAMYSHARMWAPDLQVIECRSIDITQVKPQPGKAAAWQAVFFAPALGQKRAYTFSVFDASATLRKGMFPDSPMAMSSDSRPFLIAGARVDSDQAWETARKHAEAYVKKNPNMPVSFTLELDRRTNEPVWRVIWGASASSSVFSVLVDSSTGQYVSTLH